MIDVESLVITAIRTELKKEYPNIAITSEIVDVPSSFPCVCIQESDNYVYKKTKDSAGAEHHAYLMYSVNVYSNKEQGKKTEARKIMNIVDSAFQSIGFNRTMINPIPNKDASIYRMTGRFDAIVDEGQMINGNKVFQVYGR